MQERDNGKTGPGCSQAPGPSIHIKAENLRSRLKIASGAGTTQLTVWRARDWEERWEAGTDFTGENKETVPNVGMTNLNSKM